MVHEIRTEKHIMNIGGKRRGFLDHPRDCRVQAKSLSVLAMF